MVIILKYKWQFEKQIDNVNIASVISKKIKGNVD